MRKKDIIIFEDTFRQFYLEPWEYEYCNTFCYKYLWESCVAWLSEIDNIAERKQLFILAIENFKHMCFSDPEYERKKELYLALKDCEFKESKLKELFKKHKESICRENIKSQL